MFQIYI